MKDYFPRDQLSDFITAALRGDFPRGSAFVMNSDTYGEILLDLDRRAFDSLSLEGYCYAGLVNRQIRRPVLGERAPTLMPPKPIYSVRFHFGSGRGVRIELPESEALSMTHD